LNDQDQETKDFEALRQKIVRLKQQMDILINDVMAPRSEANTAAPGFLSPSVKLDVSGDPKNLIVTADIPGMEKDQIGISLENNKILRISGNRQFTEEEKSADYIKTERMRGEFERVLKLPVPCESEGIAATYENGVLRIVIPKAPQEAEKTVKIPVK